jgi:hypothetical protein
MNQLEFLPGIMIQNGYRNSSNIKHFESIRTSNMAVVDRQIFEQDLRDCTGSNLFFRNLRLRKEKEKAFLILQGRLLY